MPERIDQREVSLSSPIEEKIAWAHWCYDEFGSSLLKDEKISELLVRVKNALRQSYRQMFKTGIVDICRKCELEEGGSCCGAGLENKYD